MSRAAIHPATATGTSTVAASHSASVRSADQGPRRHAGDAEAGRLLLPLVALCGGRGRQAEQRDQGSEQAHQRVEPDPLRRRLCHRAVQALAKSRGWPTSPSRRARRARMRCVMHARRHRPSRSGDRRTRAQRARQVQQHPWRPTNGSDCSGADCVTVRSDPSTEYPRPGALPVDRQAGGEERAGGCCDRAWR